MKSLAEPGGAAEARGGEEAGLRGGTPSSSSWWAERRPSYTSRPVTFPSNLVLTALRSEDPGCPDADSDPSPNGFGLRVLEGAVLGGAESGRLEVGKVKLKWSFLHFV